jgi:hypothetical protein
MNLYEGHCPTAFTCIARGNITAPDMQIAAKSMRVDTPVDLKWFRQHPGVRVRHRGPTVLEMLAFSLPATAKVLVELDANGKSWRHFRFSSARNGSVGFSQPRTEQRS